MSEANTKAQQAPITIKKYANRRLYNTATSSYVTLDHLCQIVKEDTQFVVYDAKTGEDITRSVLTQIIVEEESKGQNLLPISFLRQLIGFYGDSLGGLVPRYLEYSMESFSRNEEQMRALMKNAMGGLFPIQHFEEMGKQNMAFFESAMKMFTPFYDGEKGSDGGRAGSKRESGKSSAGQHNIDEMQAKLDEMQRELDRIARGERPGDKSAEKTASAKPSSKNPSGKD